MRLYTEMREFMEVRNWYNIMKIAIIDAEIIGKSKHRFPNLCCMKISSYHKRISDAVELKLDYDRLNEYDMVYISKVFTKTYVPEYVLALPNVIYGGTGFYIMNAPALPEEIEHSMPDYHLYDHWIDTKLASGVKRREFIYYTDYSIGFLTRGCHMGCWYCVNKNSKASITASPLTEFMDKKRQKLCFLDDNFLSCRDWKSIIASVIQSGKRFQFKQGLNERALTKETIGAITSWKYDREMIFAFDSVKDAKIIEEKLQLIYKISPNWKRELKFYVFCGGDKNNKYDDKFWENDIRGIFERIALLVKYGASPYIMRFEKVYESKYSTFYATIAAWCNQPSFFYKFSFRLFAQCRGMRKNGYSIYKTDIDRYMHDIGIKGSAWEAMENIENMFPDIAKVFFDLAPARKRQCKYHANP